MNNMEEREIIRGLTKGQLVWFKHRFDDEPWQIGFYHRLAPINEGAFQRYIVSGAKYVVNCQTKIDVRYITTKDPYNESKRASK